MKKNIVIVDDDERLADLMRIYLENANGEKFKVSNFSIVSKDDGNKIYTNCSAYGDKTKDLENLKQGDFVGIFGQVKTSIDNNGKEHKNVRILSSKLLKAKEQVKGVKIKIKSPY